MNKNICIVAGARPNFIKVAPVIRAIVNAQKNGQSINYSLVYAAVRTILHSRALSSTTWR